MRAGVNYGGTHIVNVSLEGPIAGATGIASAEVEADLVRADQAEPVSRAASVAWYFDNMNGLQGGEPLQNLAREFRALVIGAQRDSRKINELLAPLAGRFEQGRKALAEADTREKLEEIARNARDVFLQAFLWLERQPSYVATRGWVESARALLSSLR